MGDIEKRVATRFKTSEFHLEAMSNLLPDDTGIKWIVIWISAGEFSGVDAQHGPRVKVVLGNKVTTEGLKEAVLVRITKPPVVLGKLPGKIQKQVIRFIEKNQDILLRHWNGDLGSKATLNLLKPV